jgi:hypothetical protein
MSRAGRAIESDPFRNAGKHNQRVDCLAPQALCAAGEAACLWCVARGTCRVCAPHCWACTQWPQASAVLLATARVQFQRCALLIHTRALHCQMAALVMCGWLWRKSMCLSFEALVCLRFSGRLIQTRVHEVAPSASLVLSDNLLFPP